MCASKSDRSLLSSLPFRYDGSFFARCLRDLFFSQIFQEMWLCCHIAWFFFSLFLKRLLCVHEFLGYVDLVSSNIEKPFLLLKSIFLLHFLKSSYSILYCLMLSPHATKALFNLLQFYIFMFQFGLFCFCYSSSNSLLFISSVSDILLSPTGNL